MQQSRIVLAAAAAVVGIGCAALMMGGCQTLVDQPAAATIDFKLQEPGRVSLAVYDAEGRQVRTLLNAEPQEKGRHAVAWDGLDRDGKPLPKGEYTWKLLESQGLQAEYLMALGTSTGLNHWPGQHNGPISIACDGEAIVVGGAPEGSPLLASVDLDGTFHWNQAQFRAPEAAPDLAVDGDRLYVLENSAMVDVLQKATGARVTGTNQQPIAYRLMLPVRKLDPIAPTSDESRKIEIPVGEALPYLIRKGYLVRMTVGQNEKSDTLIGCKINGAWMGAYGLKPGAQMELLGPSAYGTPQPVESVDGKIVMEFSFKPSQPGAQWYASELELVAPVERIAARAGALVATFPAADTLAWVEPDTGKLLEQVKVSNLRDVALLNARTALVISGNNIVKVGRDGSSTAVITGLTEPTRLAWDAVSQTLWVVEGGASQQIKRFGADFKFQAALGRLGGRKQGLYQPQDFQQVGGIDGDGHGGFVICEADSAPRRSAHLDRDGKLLREWYGGQQFYTFAAAEPDDPTLVWMDSHWGYVMQVKVDYAKKDWTVRACYKWDAELDPRLFSHFKMARRLIPIRLDLKGDGKKQTYLWSDAHFGLLLKVDEAAGLLRPVAGLGVLAIGDYPNYTPFDKLPVAWQDAARKFSPTIPTSEANRLLRGFAWADANADYQMQGNELRLMPSDGHGFQGSSSSCLFVDDALTIYQGLGWSGENQPAWMCFPAKGRTPTGAPIWDWSNSVKGATTPFGSTGSLLRTPDGAMFTLSQGGGDGFAAQDTYNPGHGWQWPANQIDSSAVCKWDKDGQLLWLVGPHASRKSQKPGELHCPVYLAGRVNGAIGVCDKIISPCEFWSEDGLYIGGLLDRRADDGLPARAYAWWRRNGADGFDSGSFEDMALLQYDMNLGGSLAQLASGDVVFFGSGWNNVPVYRVKGWDQIRRQQGTVRLTGHAPQALLKGRGLAGEYFSTNSVTGTPAFCQTASRLWFEPARKGFAWPNPDGKPVLAARWTGTLEPRFSEDYTLSVYAKGNVRLWLGGKLLMDASSKVGAFNKTFAEPVRLSAGQRYALKVEWTGLVDGQCHLNWESLSQPIEHIPAVALYAELPSKLPVVSVRSSAPEVDRPTPETAAGETEWIVSRESAGSEPLEVGLEWRGTAEAGREYKPLPERVRIPAGQAEIRLPVRLIKSGAISPRRELTLAPAVAGHYLLDGTSGVAALAIRDSRNRKLSVAQVSVVGEHMGPVGIPLTLNQASLKNLINGSGLDRRTDPPAHDTDINHAWFASWSEPEKTVLTFDLGAICSVSDLRVWNLNTRSAHGLGWGQGPTVRDAARQIRLSIGDEATGPWTDLGGFKLHAPPGDRPDGGDLIAVGRKARFVRIHFVRPHESPTVGLAEVEFYGVRAVDH